LPIDEKWVTELSSYKNKDQFLFIPRTEFIISEIPKDGESSGRDAGMEVGDKIISVNDVSTPFFDHYLAETKKLRGQKVKIAVMRDQSQVVFDDVKLSDTGKIGVYRTSPIELYGSKRQDYTLLQALPAGVKKGWNFLANQVKAFSQMFRGKIKASESLGGFGSIGKMFGTTWEWERFWTMTALLSLILAFMNLLPIPALDGGHVMFLLWEVITGRKPSDKFMEIATILGFVIVLGLVVWANGMDVLRWLRGQ